MSRGLGVLQLKILDALVHYRDDEELTAYDLITRIDKAEPTPNRMRSTHRAIQTLADRGQIKPSPHTRRGRQCWVKTNKDLGPARPTARILG